MRASMVGVTKRYGEREVLRGVDWQIHAGERWALVGPNGSGKTTLLRLLSGKEEYDSGEMHRARGLRVATVPQEDLAGVSTTARAYLLKAFDEVLKKEAELERLHRDMAEGDDTQGTLNQAAEIQDWLHHHGGYTYEVELDRCLVGLGFAVDDGERPCRSFSGGEQMRLKLGRALLDPADLLLLDEPGNHLDDTQRGWLGQFLKDCPRAFVVVTHDPEILEGAVDHVAYLLDGKLYSFRGDFASFQTQFEEMQKTRERAYEQQQAFIARTEEFIRRYKAGQRSKQARGREKVLSRLERVEAPLRGPDGFKLRLTFEGITGEDVLAVRGLRLAMGPMELSVPKLDLKRGQKVALIGANGSGKTTLLRALVGETRPVAGEIRWGTNVVLAHYDQHQRRLPHGESLFNTVGNLLKTPNREQIMSHLGAFGFGGARAEQGVASLSGGERARLHLLAVLLAHANVLVLDEPTNHLDVTGVEILREALQSFKGTLVLVSHDEDFLKSLVDQTWAVVEGTVRSAAHYDPRLLEVRKASKSSSEGRPSQPAKAGAAASSTEPKPMSKNERFRAEKRKADADALVARLTVDKEAMERRFSDPDAVFAADWRKLHDRFEELKAELAAAEEEWLQAVTALEEDDALR
jgi:ATP-binding cassette, subfamily F, member 3